MKERVKCLCDPDNVESLSLYRTWHVTAAVFGICFTPSGALQRDLWGFMLDDDSTCGIGTEKVLRGI